MLCKLSLAASESFNYPVVAIDRIGRIVCLNSAVTKETGVYLSNVHMQNFADIFYKGVILDANGEFISPLIETLCTSREMASLNRDIITIYHRERRRFLVNTWVMDGEDGQPGLVWGIYLPVGHRRQFLISNMLPVRSICKSIGLHDIYTKGHMERVSIYALAIGHALSISKSDLAYLFVAGMTHDSGKIFVPAHILNKPGRLTDKEAAIIRQHPEHGGTLLKANHLPMKVIEAVTYHHERFDGKGYPAGLHSKKIPLLSRILAVADAFEAMMSGRSYRPAMTLKSALAELERNAGSQFDPHVVRAILDFVDSGNNTNCRTCDNCRYLRQCGCWVPMHRFNTNIHGAHGRITGVAPV